MYYLVPTMKHNEDLHKQRWSLAAKSNMPARRFSRQVRSLFSKPGRSTPRSSGTITPKPPLTLSESKTTTLTEFCWGCRGRVARQAC